MTLPIIVFWFLSFVWTVVCVSLKAGIEIDVASTTALDEAAYAVGALSDLSDSEIYKSLKLSRILSARTHNGVYHNNVLLDLELSSPHFHSGLDSETFSFIVMNHKEDGSKSFAIDEFPVMKEEDIELFQIEKIKRKRREKQLIFKKMEEEALLAGVHPSQVSNEYFDESLFSEGETIEAVLTALDTASARELRLRDSEGGVQARLSGVFLEEERRLSVCSLLELYEFVTGVQEVSSYVKYRSKHILHDLLLRRNRR